MTPDGGSEVGRELSEAELVDWGARLAGRLPAGPVWIGLRGPLGAGKSVLARAIARGLGVDAEMPSPTYNLLFLYEGHEGRTIAHLDLYRLRSEEELQELGWEDLGGEDQVVLVEWPDRAQDSWPEGAIEIELSMAKGRPERRALALKGGPSPLGNPT